jgi:hypothetical protein
MKQEEYIEEMTMVVEELRSFGKSEGIDHLHELPRIFVRK